MRSNFADEEARIRTADQCPSEIENSDVNSEEAELVLGPILLTKKSGVFACRELQTSTHRAAE